MVNSVNYQPDHSPLIYKVKSQDEKKAKTLGYILGTIHVSDQDIQLTEKIIKKIKKCNSLAV